MGVCRQCCGLLFCFYSEREFLKQLRDKMVEKTQRGVLNYGEPVTMTLWGHYKIHHTCFV